MSVDTVVVVRASFGRGNLEPCLSVAWSSSRSISYYRSEINIAKSEQSSHTPGSSHQRPL